MGTYINGLDAGRDQPKELPRKEPEPRSTIGVQKVVERAVNEEAQGRMLLRALAFGERFIDTFFDYSFRVTRPRRKNVVSRRAAQVIAADVTAFFAQRPRPWRPASQRAKVDHSRRFTYRKAVR